MKSVQLMSKLYEGNLYFIRKGQTTYLINNFKKEIINQLCKYKQVYVLR